MKESSIINHFSTIKDPRLVAKSDHKLIDIIVLAICGIICGADDWVSIEQFGNAKLSWFKRFLELPYGIPSHDTFGRVFAKIDPKTFQRCFLNWVQAATERCDGQVIPIDGKTLRRSYDSKSNKAAIHMVSAWATENRMVLGQVKTHEKSNEITAIPELLNLLDISGCIVTIDAMGCQKKITQQIVDQGGDYVLGLKGNQPSLFVAVEEQFQQTDEAEFSGPDFDYHQTEESGHGRKEIRSHFITEKIGFIPGIGAWSGLKSIGIVISQRSEKGKTTTDWRYYITSLPKDAKQFAHAIRSHWGIENSLHWVLDVAFREDECRVRKDNAPENLAVLRHIALNLIRQEKTAKVGVKNKRLKAGWDNDYLAKVLFG